MLSALRALRTLCGCCLQRPPDGSGRMRRCQHWLDFHAQLRDGLGMLSLMATNCSRSTNAKRVSERCKQYLRALDTFMTAYSAHVLFERHRLLPFLAELGARTDDLLAAHDEAQFLAAELTQCAGFAAHRGMASARSISDMSDISAKYNSDLPAEELLLTLTAAFAQHMRANMELEEARLVPLWANCTPGQYARYRGRYCHDPCYEDLGGGVWAPRVQRQQQQQQQLQEMQRKQKALERALAASSGPSSSSSSNQNQNQNQVAPFRY